MFGLLQQVLVVLLVALQRGFAIWAGLIELVLRFQFVQVLKFVPILLIVAVEWEQVEETACFQLTEIGTI